MATTANKRASANSVKAVAAKASQPRDAATPVPKAASKATAKPEARNSASVDELKQRAGKLASPAKKSELIRAGVKALAAMTDIAFLAALKAVPAIKTGRPAKA